MVQRNGVGVAGGRITQWPQPSGCMRYQTSWPPSRKDEAEPERLRRFADGYLTSMVRLPLPELEPKESNNEQPRR